MGFLSRICSIQVYFETLSISASGGAEDVGCFLLGLRAENLGSIVFVV